MQNDLKENIKTEFKLPKKNQPFFSFIKRILKVFYKKPKIINVAGKIKSPSIIVCNHSSIKGPIMYELYLPVKSSKWGAGEMLGNYKTRFKYLRNVYFMQKKNYRKSTATILAFFDAFFSIFIYKGMRVMPTWKDSRMFSTIKNTIEVLKNGTSVAIFPENSNNGYKEVLTEFNPGFVSLAENFYRKTNTDLPIYPVYYHSKTNTMVIGKQSFLQTFQKRGLNREQISKEFCNKVNNLFFKHIKCNKLN